MSLGQLLEFETRLDEEIEALPIWNLPVRCVIAALHHTVYSLLNSDQEKAITVAGRASSLVRLLAKCPAEPTGESAHNAISAYADLDPDCQQLMLAINYGHFSELMPEVHRGYYDVTLAKNNHFQLHHHNRTFADSETKDILLSELAIPHVTGRRPDMSTTVSQLARTVPKADLKLAAQVQGAYIDHYLKNVTEPRLLSDSVLRF